MRLVWEDWFGKQNSLEKRDSYGKRDWFGKARLGNKRRNRKLNRELKDGAY